MFVKIRNRLTILYTSVMAVFLLSFVIMSYFMLSTTIYQDRIKEIKNINYEIMKHRNELIVIPNKDDHGEDDDEELDLRKKNIYFYYLVSNSGQFMGGAEMNYDPVAREQILKKASGWIPNKDEVRFEEIKTRDGGKYLALSGLPVYNLVGGFEGVMYTGIDLTEQHHVLQVYMVISIILSIIFLILSAFIGHYLAGKAMVPIMQSFARQREFVADASHELRTPLSVLQSSLEVIEAEEENHLNDFSRQVVVDMKDEVGRMSKLVGDLLTLARADSGTLELNREAFDLRMVADQVVRTLQPIVGKKEQTFSYDGDENIPVFADRERITQLLYILLDNAMKYTPEKGIITLGIEASAKGIQLVVKDNGVGMTQQQAERIFDRFYRVDKGRSREMGGTGLGLSIANWIVTAHGGTIQVISTVGKGSTFKISLPIQDKEHSLQ